MKNSERDRFERLKRAAQIIVSMLDNPSQQLISKAENAGCLDETDFLLEEMRVWLDDDMYFEDVAWEMANNQARFKVSY
jgi:hypothetical protein